MLSAYKNQRRNGVMEGFKPWGALLLPTTQPVTRLPREDAHILMKIRNP